MHYKFFKLLFRTTIILFEFRFIKNQPHKTFLCSTNVFFSIRPNRYSYDMLFVFSVYRQRRGRIAVIAHKSNIRRGREQRGKRVIIHLLT